MNVKIFGMAGGLMLLATAAFALPPMWKVVQETYKPPKNGKIEKAKCVTCHVATGKSALNSYGKDVKEALKGSKTLTAEMLKGIEDKDSDGDEVKNGEELKADSLPGDKKSVPAKKK